MTTITAIERMDEAAKEIIYTINMFTSGKIQAEQEQAARTLIRNRAELIEILTDMLIDRIIETDETMELLKPN